MTKEEKNEYMRKWNAYKKATDPEWVKKKREYSRISAARIRKKYPEKVKAQNKKRSAYKIEWARKDRKKNPQKHRDKDNKFWRNNRAQWIAENGPCQKCQSWERLEVDHKDPKDKVTHSVWTWSHERRTEELKKCWVLCFSCHRLKTNEERGWSAHGVIRYRLGCRCKECVRRYNKNLRDPRSQKCH